MPREIWSAPATLPLCASSGASRTSRTRVLPLAIISRASAGVTRGTAAFAASSNCLTVVAICPPCALALQVPLELPGVRRQQIPGMGAGGEEIHARLMKSRIVEIASHQSEDLRQPSQPVRHPASADGTEAPFDHAAIVADDLVVSELALDLDRTQRHDDDRRIGRPARALTVTAMAVHHQDRLGIHDIAHRAAAASSGYPGFRLHLAAPVRLPI